MILGDACTRNCGFCSVHSSGPSLPDPSEPERVALAARELGLKYVVVTSVTRDDLPDGGASLFAATIKEIRHHLPEARIEVLTPDFLGSRDSLNMVLECKPDVFNHNVETAARLYPVVRPQAIYRRSLQVLEYAQSKGNGIPVKSGFMVGLGETFDEVVTLISDLRESGCTLLTIGQYLRPERENLPVKEYIHPDTFKRYHDIAIEAGFSFVASGPLVRSSMNAEEMYLPK